VEVTGIGWRGIGKGVLLEKVGHWERGTMGKFGHWKKGVNRKEVWDHQKRKVAGKRVHLERRGVNDKGRSQ